jgi:MT0933-like antitoxin protein
MPDFGEMADKAKDFADDKTGNKYGGQIQSGEDEAESYLGVEDQDQQNQSNN